MKKQFGQNIVVIDNGFVMVGDVSRDGEFYRIESCRNIRVWGTTQGLGQLRTGPVKETKSDECGTVVVPHSRLIFLMPCSGWLLREAS